MKDFFAKLPGLGSDNPATKKKAIYSYSILLVFWVITLSVIFIRVNNMFADQRLADPDVVQPQDKKFTTKRTGEDRVFAEKLDVKDKLLVSAPAGKKEIQLDRQQLQTPVDNQLQIKSAEQSRERFTVVQKKETPFLFSELPSYGEKLEPARAAIAVPSRYPGEKLPGAPQPRATHSPSATSRPRQAAVKKKRVVKTARRVVKKVKKKTAPVSGKSAAPRAGSQDTRMYEVGKGNINVPVKLNNKERSGPFEFNRGEIVIEGAGVPSAAPITELMKHKNVEYSGD